MCSIYRGERFIPQNKPQLYEKCSVMLFERWDKSRGINYPLEKFVAHIKPGMMYLAHWIYITENLQSGVKKNQLIGKTAEYLEAYYPNRNEAKFVAEDFVNFCSGRAWVFTDIGQDIYKFTHQTFLEYFTACYLSQNYRTPKDIEKILLPKIKKREWDVVAHLILNILNESPTEITDEIILLFLNDYEKKKRYLMRLNILSFVASSLDYSVLTYKTIKRIVETCLSFFVISTLEQINSDKPKKNSIPLDLIDLLFLTDSRNKESIWNVAEDYLISEISNSVEKRKKILIHLVDFIKKTIFSKDEETRKKLISPSNKLILTINSLFEDNINDVIFKFDNDLISIGEVLELYGVNVFYKDKKYFGFMTDNKYLDLFYLIICYINQKPGVSKRTIGIYKTLTDKERKISSEALKKLSNQYSLENLGKFKISSAFLYDYYISSSNANKFIDMLQIRLKGDELFGAFLLLAPTAELLQGNLQELLIMSIEDGTQKKKEKRNNIKPVVGELSFTFLGREAFDTYKEQIEFEIENLELSKDQKSTIWKWVRKEISFLK